MAIALLLEPMMLQEVIFRQLKKNRDQDEESFHDLFMDVPAKLLNGSPSVFGKHWMRTPTGGGEFWHIVDFPCCHIC